VQLTHDSNYKFYGDLLGINLLEDPDLALEPDVALYVLVHGMMKGKFGTPLTRNVNERKTDFVEARTSVNDHDRATHIAGIAERWLTWIRSSQPNRFTRGFDRHHAPGPALGCAGAPRNWPSRIGRKLPAVSLSFLIARSGVGA
jgi:hypothetical protein